MLTYEKALNILRSYDLKEGDDWDRHCINVGEIAYKLAKEVAKYREIYPERVRIMGLVHDFGRSVTHDPYIHAYEGYRIMKELGYDDYARICVCHSNGTYRPEDLDKYGLKPQDFFVENLEEMLVFIGDSLEYKGGIIRHDIRIGSTIERYKVKFPEFVPILESKLCEFKNFDMQIETIIGKNVYAFLEI